MSSTQQAREPWFKEKMESPWPKGKCKVIIGPRFSISDFCGGFSISDFCGGFSISDFCGGFSISDFCKNWDY